MGTRAAVLELSASLNSKAIWTTLDRLELSVRGPRLMTDELHECQNGPFEVVSKVASEWGKR
jgi:hypothetical protein